MKTLVTIVLVLMVAVGMAQETKSQKKAATDDIYYTPLNIEAQAKEQAGEPNMNRIVLCLDNYRKERRNALLIGIAGAGAMVGGSFADGSAQQALYIGGAIMAATSAGLYIHAERWLGKKKLLYTGNGVALKF